MLCSWVLAKHWAILPCEFWTEGTSSIREITKRFFLHDYSYAREQSKLFHWHPNCALFFLWSQCIDRSSRFHRSSLEQIDAEHWLRTCCALEIQGFLLLYISHLKLPGSRDTAVSDIWNLFVYSSAYDKIIGPKPGYCAKSKLSFHDTSTRYISTPFMNKKCHFEHLVLLNFWKLTTNYFKILY